MYLLEVKGLSKYFGGIKAVEEITFKVKEGIIMSIIGRALMSNPKLLLLDEPSLGLAPIIVSKIFKTINGINREGVTVLLVEQNARAALKLSHRGYVLENGRIALEGKGEELLNNEQVRGAYQIRPLVS